MSTATADDVRWLVSDCNKTYMVKGHIEPAAMKTAVQAYGEDDIASYRGPTHEWWRAYPKIDECGDRVTWYAPADAGARGAFKCTVLIKDW